MLTRFPKGHLQIAVSVTLILASSCCVRAGELDRIQKFLEDHAVNRTLAQEDEGTIADGKVAYEFRREATMCNLIRSGNGIKYDVVCVIKQKNWDVQNGKKTGEPRIEDRIVVQRYEFGQRNSTGEVIGFSYAITTTRKDHNGATTVIRAKLEDDELHLRLLPGDYDDYFGSGGKFFPGTDVENQVWRVKEGKLVCESRIKTFRVDPKTGEKHPLVASDTPTVETEVAKLPLK